MRRGIRLLAAALAVSAATAACSDDPGAGTLPTTSPSAATHSATTPSPSATEDLRASLEAALHEYFDALYAAGMDPANNTDALASLIDPSCTCRRVIAVLKELARERHHIDYRYALRGVQVIDVGARGGDIKYTVARSAGAERDASGRVIKRYPATVEKYVARLRQSNGRWLLARLTRFS